MKTLRLVGSVAVLSTLVGSAFALGCSVESKDGSDGAQESDITGSLANAQACAVRDAYTRATVSDFTLTVAQHLPFAFSLPPGAARPLFASFEVPGLGNVYYVEYTAYFDSGSAVIGSFTSSTGQPLLRSTGSTTATSFYSIAGGPLSCGGGSSSTSSSGSWGTSSSGSSGSSSGCWGAGCVPEAGPPSSSSTSSSGWTPPPGCYGAGCVPEAGTP